MKAKILKLLTSAVFGSLFVLGSCAGGTAVSNQESNDTGISSSVDSTSDEGGDENSGNEDSTGGQTGGDTVDHPIETNERTEDGDLNIYFTSSTIEAPDSSYIWMWNDDDASFLFPACTEQVVIPEISDELLFTAVHLTFGQEYNAYTDWQATKPGTMTIPDKDYLNYIIFRSAPDASVINQTSDMGIVTDLMVPDGNGNYNIYIDGTRNSIYYRAEDFPVSTVTNANYGESLSPSGKAVGWIDLVGKEMEDTFTDFNESFIIVKEFFYNLVSGTRVYYNDLVKINYDACEVTSDTGARIFFEEPLDITEQYEVQVRDKDSGSLAYSCDVSYINYFSTPAFDREYYTDEQMGAFIRTNDDGNEETVFHVWSPSASSGSVSIYDDAGTKEYDEYRLKNIGQGVFEAVVPGNLHGKYYTYNINNYGIMSNDVPDPYALSSNANGKRSMVVDWNKVSKPQTYDSYDKNGWTPDYKNYAGVSIMEMHTRDFTSSDSWNGPKEDVGKFKGLYDEGTKLSDGTPTGFDYVKRLKENGLTHVQIMPAFDFSSVDETKLDDPEYQSEAKNGIYNWGYDPQQYNVPEGSYSSDPNDGETRVEEFMNFVNSYNDIGVGVIMDVVYNHMPGQSGTSFDRVFPNYYFRSGNDVSGAGVDVASQHSMVRKFIVDSVVGWAEHYHVSGFRFDLMGIIDLQTMKAVRQALDEIDPNILVYGEGWQMFYDNTDPSSGLTAVDMAYQGSLKYMGEDWVGSFNDDVRDAIKGQQSGDGSILDRGYAQNGVLGGDQGTMDFQRGKILYGLTGTLGYTTQNNRPQYAPGAHDGVGASINYTECHDNLTLWDKLSMSVGENERQYVPTMAKMANATVLSSLSPAFFQIGQDFGRSKAYTDEKFKVDGQYFEDPVLKGTYYSHNSYNLSDEINQVDWSLLSKDANKDMETSFLSCLSQRKAASEGLAEMFVDNGGNPSAAVFNNTVDGCTYRCGGDVSSNVYIVGYSLERNGKQYVVINNYSTDSITYLGVTCGPKSAVISCN